MLSCKDISNLASDHIDNNLSPFMSMKVKMHLFMCRNCRNFVEQLSITVNILKGLQSPQLEEEAVDRQVSELLEIAKTLRSESAKKPENKDH